MTTDTSQPGLVGDLVGCELSVVAFVRDYVQFSFEGTSGTHVLSAYNDPVVSEGLSTIRRGDARWESELVAQINKTVRRAAVDGTAIAIAF